jgi:2-iminoacetate synthase ThiH
VYYLSLEQIQNAIREAGYIPRQRNVFYEYIDETPAQYIAGSGLNPSLPALT